MNEVKRDNVFLRSLIEQVAYNCDVSDSRYWGFFSMCGLLMSLRILYMAKHDFAPWAQIDRDDISKWIAAKEARWDELEDEDFKDIEIDGTIYDPFDAVAINSVLAEKGLVYGAGYGLFKKPSFFLADLQSQTELRGCTVYFSAAEHERDLFTSPGMLRENQIFLRLQPLRVLLWDKFLESQAKNNRALAYAFLQYGLEAGQPMDEVFEKNFDELVRRYAEVILYHELGEVAEAIPEWPDILLEVDTKESEFFLRAVEDLLSDTSEHGPLKRAIDAMDAANLSLHIALMDRYKVKMHAEVKDAFEDFMISRNWNEIDKARESVHDRLTLVRDRILETYNARTSKDDLIGRLKEIQQTL